MNIQQSLLKRLRNRAAEILQTNRSYDLASRFFDVGLIAVITLNVIAVILSSEAELYQQYQDQFDYFEIFSVMIFSIEYLARLWSCIDTKEAIGLSAFKARLKYMFSPMALIDLVSILPFYLGYFFSFDLRMLRIIRLVRIFKLTRYSGAMGTLLTVMREEFSALSAAFFVIFMTMTLAASGIYVIEHDVQPDNFGSIPESMWWAVSTLTTVGYGDVVPITSLGKIFGGIIIFLGIGLVALPTGIIASGFANTFRRRRVRYESVLDEALLDGVLTEKENKELYMLREQLDISGEDAEMIYKLALDRLQLDRAPCSHCGKKR